MTSWNTIFSLAVFVTEICLTRGMNLSTRPSSLRLTLACSSDEVQGGPAVSTLNSSGRASARQSRIGNEDHTNDILETPCVIRFPATEFLLPLLIPSKPVSIVADIALVVKVKELKVEEPPARRV